MSGVRLTAIVFLALGVGGLLLKSLWASTISASLQRRMTWLPRRLTGSSCGTSKSGIPFSAATTLPEHGATSGTPKIA